MTVKNVTWFTTGRGECIGIVQIENEMEERKAYIGLGDGHDEGLDIEIIKDWGAKAYPQTLRQIADWLEGING